MATIITGLFLTLVAALYTLGARARRAGIRRFQMAAFVAGWTTTAVALMPPLDELAETYLSSHMLQHELLMVIAAPLLAVGRPHQVLLALLPRARRGRSATKFRRLRISMPLAWALHAVAVWAWHLPALYQAAAAQPLLHIAQHASFAGTALLFWCSVLERRREYGAAALYTFATSVHTGILGALMYLTPQPWYPIYGNSLAAREDQQLAGLLMWIPGGALLAFTAVCLLWFWLHDIEQRIVMREKLTVIHSRARRVVVILVIWIGSAALLSACNDARATAVALTGGNPENGQAAIRRHGCWTCHNIPGIAGANGVVGPPLDGIANRAYVAGRANNPEQMMNWIRRPQSVRTPTPMPDTGVNEREARDIAAYLYTLQ
jgi:cytochrome c oxidase assembly factor CtaG/cytochrome c2